MLKRSLADNGRALRAKVLFLEMKRRVFYLLLLKLAGGVFVPGGRGWVLPSPPVPLRTSAAADETSCNRVLA